MSKKYIEEAFKKRSVRQQTHSNASLVKDASQSGDEDATKEYKERHQTIDFDETSKIYGPRKSPFFADKVAPRVFSKDLNSLSF